MKLLSVKVDDRLDLCTIMTTMMIDDDEDVFITSCSERLLLLLCYNSINDRPS